MNECNSGILNEVSGERAVELDEMLTKNWICALARDMERSMTDRKVLYKSYTMSRY